MFCAVCFRTEPAPDLPCQGDCFRDYHSACIKLRDDVELCDWQCDDCFADKAVCFICNKSGKIAPSSEFPVTASKKSTKRAPAKAAPSPPDISSSDLSQEPIVEPPAAASSSAMKVEMDAMDDKKIKDITVTKYKRPDGCTEITLVAGAHKGMYPYIYDDDVLQFEDMGIVEAENIKIQWPETRIRKGAPPIVDIQLDKRMF